MQLSCERKYLKTIANDKKGSMRWTEKGAICATKTDTHVVNVIHSVNITRKKKINRLCVILFIGAYVHNLSIMKEKRRQQVYSTTYTYTQAL